MHQKISLLLVQFGMFRTLSKDNHNLEVQKMTEGHIAEGSKCARLVVIANIAELITSAILAAVQRRRVARARTRCVWVKRFNCTGNRDTIRKPR